MGRRKRNSQSIVEPMRRKEFIKIAKELGYKEHVIEKLKSATTEGEITRILADARMGIER